MSEAPTTTIRARIAGRWQIPVFVAGSLVFAASVFRISSGQQTLSFDQQLQRIEVLRVNGALTRMNAYILHLLRDTERPTAEQAELFRLLVKAVHAAESQYTIHRRENIQTIISSFDQAVALGARPTGEDYAALADAYFWGGRSRDGEDALRQALRVGVVHPDHFRRRLVDLDSPAGAPISPGAMADLELILADANALPSNYYWATERRVRWLLESDRVAEAAAMVEEARSRLDGTPEKPAVDYLQAYSLRATGRADESETLLRSLRDSLNLRDELWGRCGWLLGRLELEDDRPESAMAFFRDVLAAFPSGPIADACELGRAEAMVMLERPARALEVFRRLRDQLPEGRYHEYMDRDVVRMTLTTIGRELLEGSRRELGVKFLESALSFAQPEDTRLRGQYLAQIAAGLRLSAVMTDTRTPEGLLKAQQLFRRAGEVNLARSELAAAEPIAAASAMEQAADDFDRAGLVHQVISNLSRFNERYTIEQIPLVRGRILHRLARAYQAVGDYTNAVESYDRVIEEFPRQPEALDSMVPRAECLIRLGGEEAVRGARQLVEIVDDRGPAPLFTPSAQEYRDALMLLAEYHVLPDAVELERTANQPEESLTRLNTGVTRLEDALALYPDDSRVPRLRFLLAEAYRQSATLVPQLRSEEESTLRRESDRRLRLAMENYERVKDMFARRDASDLTDLERTYLRASYLYVGDCLFDMGEIERAADSYRETAWRYENEPAAVAAMMQVVNCYQRLGRMDEARSALARMQWLLKTIPDEAFSAASGMSPRSYWQDMVKRMERTTSS